MFYVGIDVAKLRHEVVILDEQGVVQGKPLSIANTAKGFADLVARLKSLGPASGCKVALEATGPYGWPLEYHLRGQGFAVVLLNPLQTASFSKSGIRKTKNDRIDARSIAELLRCGKALASIIPDEYSLRLRELTRYRVAALNLAKRWRSLLSSRLARVFPELASCFEDVAAPTALNLIETYPDPKDLATAPSRELAQDLWRRSRGKLSQARAAELQRIAAATIGIPLARDVYALQLKGIVQILRMLGAHVDVITTRITEVLRERPEVLTSIPGVGDLTAAAVLGEVVDIKHFSAPEKLVAFAGYDPSTFQSGEFLSTQASISKRGSPYLRLALWNAAFSSLKFNPDCRAYYDKKRAQGKHHKSALGAVCRKLLHVIWRLLRDNRPWESRTAPSKGPPTFSADPERSSPP
jgi:transposase